MTLRRWTTSICLKKKRKELETLIQSTRIYSQDKGIEFGRQKCAMLIMKSGKRKRKEGVKRPNQERITKLREKENFKYWGILEVGTIKQLEIKEKLEKVP